MSEIPLDLALHDWWKKIAGYAAQSLIERELKLTLPPRSEER
jgi:hypothetical protein